jgi:hypothetical protein
VGACLVDYRRIRAPRARSAQAPHPWVHPECAAAATLLVLLSSFLR